MALMKAQTFQLLMSAERKLEQKQPLTAEEQQAVDIHGLFERKRCGCGCGQLLEPRVDGERHKIDGKEVNSDCYFAKLGDAVEQHPIGGHGIRRAIGAH